jgi:hypothetical protein
MRTWPRPRRVPARSRVPANEKARRQFPGAGSKLLRCFRCTCDLPDVSNYSCQIIRVKLFLGRISRQAAVRFKKPATDFPARALKFLRRYEYARDLPDVSNSFFRITETGSRQDAGFAGWAGFGPGAAGSSGGFGAVGVTVAPTAWAAAAVVA